jgi:hypothetical protein
VGGVLATQGRTLAMKKLLVFLVAAFVLVMSQGLREVAAGDAGDDEGVPLKALAGKYSDTAQGSFALCLDPKNNFALISCADAKAKVFPLTTVQVGNETDDTKGTSCETYTETDSDLPPDLSPPLSPYFKLLAQLRVMTPRRDRVTAPLSATVAGSA